LIVLFLYKKKKGIKLKKFFLYSMII